MPKKKDEDVKMPEMKTADKLFEEEKDVKILATDTPIDELIGGGIRDNEVVEFYGEYGVGKTQISLTLAAMVAASDNDVIYVDCENTFRPKRMWQIAESRGYNPEQVLSRIYVARPESVAQQVAFLDAIPKNLKPKLLVVDGLTCLFRAEFIGREQLHVRQPLLGGYLKKLKDYARENKVATIVTNQVYASPDGSPMFLPLEFRELAVGGHTLYHSIDNRIFIQKAKEGKRLAKLIDSSCYPKQERIFRITEKGVEGDIIKEGNKDG